MNFISVLSCLSLLLDKTFVMTKQYMWKACKILLLQTFNILKDKTGHKDGTQTMIKLSCKKKALDTSFIPMHVPSDAKLMGQVFLGSSSSFGMGVLVNTWYGDLPHNGKWEHCKVNFCLYFSTFNWVVRKSNPIDYIPPFFCAKSKLEETETPDTVFTALKSLAVKTKKEA
uniref:C-type lectin domain-containing protein n=1 Tax=Seriola dumerili TaxID=41447 RepID=A0A3B4U5Y0_SERDU